MTVPTLTLPSDAMNFIINGDLDVFSGLVTADNGDGTIWLRNGGLYVTGLSDLAETTISTATGPFNVYGANLVDFNITNSINLTATTASNFTTTAGILTLSSTATGSTGQVQIIADGTGANSLLLQANNTTSGQITLQSAGGSTTIAPILIESTDSTNGYITIQAAGNFAASNPAILLNAQSTVSGQIALISAGNDVSSDSIYLYAPGTLGGNINLTAAGSTQPAINISSTSTSGQVLINSNGTSDTAISLTSAGGISMTGTGKILITTSDLTNGVKIATGTAGVPVTIGTSTSVTTIAGDLNVLGTTTTINTVSLTVEDNVVILNSGSASLSADAGLAVRRYQTPNGTPTGDIIATPNPIQESGAFQTGSATPGTLVLAPFTSVTNNYYVGWWIEITSGSGINQVRRIKSYVGSTHTATIYQTADNTTTPVVFSDGLDLVTAPASGDTYQLYSDVYITSFYDETTYLWEFYTSASVDTLGISSSNVQQPQQIVSGSHTILPQTYNNVFGSASTTTVTFTLIGHGLSMGYKVSLANSSNFTPSITPGIYNVASVPTANTFTITVAASTTSTTASSASISILESSVLSVNVIQAATPGFPISIPGISVSEYIIIPQSSTALFTVTNSNIQGSYLLLIADVYNTTGTFGVFAASGNGSTTGTVSRISVAKGSSGQRINATWTAGSQIQIFQSTAFTSPSGNSTYIVRLISAL
jgi:hypothetical protein